MGRATRIEEYSSDAIIEGFAGRDWIESHALLAGSLNETAAAASEVVTVTVTGTPTGGTFKLAYGGEQTGNIAFNALASAVETALEALPALGGANVNVTGAAGGPYTVTFAGELAGINVSDIDPVLPTALTGGTAPSVTTTVVSQGSGGGGQYTLKRGTILTKVPGDATKVRRYTAAAGESSATIVGILARDVTRFAPVSPDEDIDVNVYCHGAVFRTWNIIDYATHEADLKASPAFTGARWRELS
jgi:hypothetical protein